jgi:hypothetical protein
MRRVLLAAILGLLSMAPTCVPTPTPQPPDPVVVDATILEDAAAQPEASTPDVVITDASATVCGRACANLATLKCASGGPTCEIACTKIVATKLTPFDAACITAAASQAAVLKCKGGSCN